MGNPSFTFTDCGILVSIMIKRTWLPVVGIVAEVDILIGLFRRDAVAAAAAAPSNGSFDGAASSLSPLSLGEANGSSK